MAILVETAVEHLPATDPVVGVDAGVESLVPLSSGEKVTKPRCERRNRQRLAKAQQELSRKQQGANRTTARSPGSMRRAATASGSLHKLTTRLIGENQTLVLENLHVPGMPGNGTLARAISDASGPQFRSMQEDKTHWYDRAVSTVDQWFPSSKTCSACGKLAGAIPLRVRSWTCPDCGTAHDRDGNTAQNIRAAGLAVSACGNGLKPARR